MFVARLMFELAAEAYEVLSDERKRRNFDQYGTPGVRFGGTTSGRGGPGRARGPDSYDPEELYSKIFGEASELGRGKRLQLFIIIIIVIIIIVTVVDAVVVIVLFGHCMNVASDAEEKADELEYEDFAGSASGHDSTKEYRIAIVRGM